MSTPALQLAAGGLIIYLWSGTRSTILNEQECLEQKAGFLIRGHWHSADFRFLFTRGKLKMPLQHMVTIFKFAYCYLGTPCKEGVHEKCCSPTQVNNQTKKMTNME